MHADGKAYRWWQSGVEYVSSYCVVTRNKIGDTTYEPGVNWNMKFNSRAFYWANRNYNLIEIYDDLGEAAQIYINIASPFKLDTMQLSYFDYELDVSMKKGHPAEILDEDEFAQAIDEYQYSDNFVHLCREALATAVTLAEHWEWRNHFENLKELEGVSD
jgi:protein associated with RNAse G/E